MAIAKIKINGEWLELYGPEMSGRLKVLENLADVADPDIARENLGLSGDVTSHNHDSRYLPLIESMQDGNVDISASVAVEKQERIEADNTINNEINNIKKDIKKWFNDSVLSVAYGGTGASSAEMARINLGIVEATNTVAGLMSASDKANLDFLINNNNSDINKYPSWWLDRGIGSDGAFTPASNVTISGEKNYTSVNIPSGVTVTTTDCKIKCQGEFVNNGIVMVTANGAKFEASGYVSNGGAGGNGRFSQKDGLHQGTAGGSKKTDTFARLLTYGFLEYGIGSGGGCGGGESNGEEEGWQGYGGDGGGSLAIIAKNFTNTGTIQANGADGDIGYTYRHESYARGAGGGGGGGSILIFANSISNTGTIQAKGGKGGPYTKSKYNGTTWTAYKGANGGTGLVYMKEVL